MASSNVVAVVNGMPDGLASLGVGLVGVWLARWVFVNRENRRLGTHQGWNETLPLTLVAALITLVIIYDKGLGVSAAAFTGLGVGWVAVLLLDILGDRITNVLRAGFVEPLPPQVKSKADLSGLDGKVMQETDLPDDMVEQLRLIDRRDDKPS